MKATPNEHALACVILGMLTDGPTTREEIELAVTGAIGWLAGCGSIELCDNDRRWRLRGKDGAQ